MSAARNFYEAVYAWRFIIGGVTQLPVPDASAAPLPGFRHPSSKAYQAGCRCGRCRRAWNRYMRRYRAARRGERAGWYRGPARRVTVELTPLGLGIARARAAASGRRLGDVVEAALRQVSSNN